MRLSVKVTGPPAAICFLNNGMNDISETMEESTNGIIKITESTVELVANLSAILEEVGNNKRIAKELQEEVDKFR